MKRQKTLEVLRQQIILQLGVGHQVLLQAVDLKQQQHRGQVVFGIWNGVFSTAGGKFGI